MIIIISPSIRKTINLDYANPQVDDEKLKIDVDDDYNDDQRCYKMVMMLMMYHDTMHVKVEMIKVEMVMISMPLDERREERGYCAENIKT